MPVQDILQSIDQEISQLQRARTLLTGDTIVEMPGRRRGRPKGSTNKPEAAHASVPKKATKRTMSLEGKARIAAAQKARWAKQKKAATTAAKTTSTLSKAAIKKASPQKTSPAKKKAAPVKLISSGQSASWSAEPAAE